MKFFCFIVLFAATLSGFIWHFIIPHDETREGFVMSMYQPYKLATAPEALAWDRVDYTAVTVKLSPEDAKLVQEGDMIVWTFKKSILLGNQYGTVRFVKCIKKE